MKAISLWQPWAHLMAIGAKQNETRSWPTNHRGWLAIHAAKKWTREIQALCETQPFEQYVNGVPGGLVTGAIVAVVRLHTCIEITTTNAPNTEEFHFGDYTPGRFMWRTTDRTQLPTPIPFKGRQGLFEVPDELLREYIR
jgi:hypothetical protein